MFKIAYKSIWGIYFKKSDGVTSIIFVCFRMDTRMWRYTVKMSLCDKDGV